MRLDVAEALDLPPGEPTEWRLVSPWEDQRIGELELRAGEAEEVTLLPFEVLVFDAEPD
jgi:hypothetical protein